jgi:hypothetical protein
MKNSKKYSVKIKKLYSSLKRDNGKVEKPEFEGPVEAVVYAAISEHMKEADAGDMYKRFGEHFVDLNDLRVSRKEEIIDILCNKIDREKAVLTASCLTGFLNDVFKRYDVVSLSALFELGKRESRKELESYESLSRFVIDYCFMVALDGHSIPLTKAMLEHLRANGLVNSSSDDSDINGFLERQISAKDDYEFYTLLREESEKKEGKKVSGKGGTEKASKTRKKTTRKKKTKKKTKKTTKKKSKKKTKTTKRKTKKKTKKRTTKSKKT